MDVSLRVLNKVQISTSITIARFLSTSLKDTMSPLQICVFSALVLMVTYIFKHEYVLSPLSRRLAALLVLEKLRPMLGEHIDDGMIFHVHGLMVNAGFLSLLSVVPASIQKTDEGSLLVQSITYLYSDIFGFLVQHKNMHATYLAVGLFGIAFLSRLDVKMSHMFSTSIEIVSVSLTYLVLAILQSFGDSLSETAVLQTLLVFTLLHFAHLPGMDSVEDYLVYSVALSLQGMVKSDAWYWVGILFILMQALSAWLTIKSMAVQVLLLVVVNLAVAQTLVYIRQLAIYDTIITLKTSALVLQFVVHELSRRLVPKV
jgi:hypothetical protein